mgnify:CR=1 FL=1
MNTRNINEELYQALDNLDEARARALLAEGADINAADEDGWTLLLRLIEPLDINSEAVHLCLKLGADSTRESKHGYSLISMLVTMDCYELLPQLLDEGLLSLSSADSHGRSILMWYARSCDSHMAGEMLARGASVHQRDKDGLTAFAHGFDRFDESVLSRMLEAGADINERNAAGHTALMVFAQTDTDSRERMRFFLEHGADVNLRSPEGQTALGYAYDTLETIRRENGDEAWIHAIIEELKTYGAKR